MTGHANKLSAELHYIIMPEAPPTAIAVRLIPRYPVGTKTNFACKLPGVEGESKSHGPQKKTKNPCITAVDSFPGTPIVAGCGGGK